MSNLHEVTQTAKLSAFRERVKYTVRDGTGGLFLPKKAAGYSKRPAEKLKNSEKVKLPTYPQELGFSVHA